MSNLEELIRSGLDHIDSDILKEMKVSIMKEFFQRDDDLLLQEAAYLAFLAQGPWGIDFNFERGVSRIAIDLNLPNAEVGLSYSECFLNPATIWSTQDVLEQGRIDLVETAFTYMVKYNKKIPPVAVWYLKNNRMYRYVNHDGHHRIAVAHKMKIKIPAIKLEYWIDNPEDPILEKKLHFQEINKLCIDLPVTQFSTL